MLRKSHPSRLMKKRRRRLILKWTLLSFLVLFIIALPAIIGRLSSIHITNITVSGTRVVPEGEVRSLVLGSLDDNYFGIYPKNNILLFSKKDTKKLLEEKFFRISEVDISIENFQTLSINIKEREPDALWCDDEGGCFFLDKTGLIFDKAPEFTDEVFVSFRGELENGDSEKKITSRIMDEETFIQFRDFLSFLRSLDLTPVLVKKLVENEYEIFLSTNEKIIITTLVPLSQTALNLSSVISDPNLSLRSESGLNVHSLDLRYGNRVFFVRKGE